MIQIVIHFNNQADWVGDYGQTLSDSITDYVNHLVDLSKEDAAAGIVSMLTISHEDIEFTSDDVSSVQAQIERELSAVIEQYLEEKITDNEMHGRV